MTDRPQLSQALRDVDPLVRAFAENAMWRVWSRSGDDTVDQLFAVGVEQMGARLGEAAVETFTEVIPRRPELAEGWNKRATLYCEPELESVQQTVETLKSMLIQRRKDTI